jgi:hypothetical protein
MGVLPRNRERTPNPKQVYFLFREDIRRMQNIARETRLLAERGIDTVEQLAAHRDGLAAQMAELSDARKHLRYKRRSIKDDERLAAANSEIAALSEQITALRREVRLCDIMVKADDAPKINRLVERFKFATVDKAKIEREITAAGAERTSETEPERGGAEPEAPDAGDTEKLLDDLLGTGEGKAVPDAPDKGDTEKLLDELLGTGGGKAAPDTPEASEPEKPGPAKTKRAKESPETPKPAKSAKAKAAEKPAKEAAERDPLAVSGPPTSNPSGPTSEKERKPERATSSRPSVKAELDGIKAARRANEAEAAKREEKVAPGRAKANPVTAHRQPNSRKTKYKSKKPKAR